MKRKEHGYITNRLLYQLSYVGLLSILNGGPQTVKRAHAPLSFLISTSGVYSGHSCPLVLCCCKQARRSARSTRHPRTSTYAARAGTADAATSAWYSCSDADGSSTHIV
jgi:hypothetical protein